MTVGAFILPDGSRRSARSWPAVTLLILALASGVSYGADESMVRASLSRNRVGIKQKLVMNVTVVCAEAAESPFFQPPSPAAFSVSPVAVVPSMRTRDEDGRQATEIAYSFTCTLTPRRIGSHAIPSAVLLYDGRVFRTDSVSVTVQTRDQAPGPTPLGVSELTPESTGAGADYVAAPPVKPAVLDSVVSLQAELSGDPPSYQAWNLHLTVSLVCLAPTSKVACRDSLSRSWTITGRDSAASIRSRLVGVQTGPGGWVVPEVTYQFTYSLRPAGVGSAPLGTVEVACGRRVYRVLDQRIDLPVANRGFPRTALRAVEVTPVASVAGTRKSPEKGAASRAPRTHPATGDSTGPVLPPRLETRLAFEETGRRNQTLDGGESANVIITVSNKSAKGTARNVRVSVEPISSISGIFIGEAVTVPEIGPGSERIVRIQLRAEEDIKNQDVRLRVSAVEPEFGADAQPGVVVITARGLEPPELRVYDNGIDDAESDWAQGNGNGQLELNEQVEVTTGIQNKGTGEALGVVVAVTATDANVVVQKSTANLGDIPAGDYRTLKYPVFVSPRFQGSQVELVLSINEQRSRFSHIDTVLIPLNQQTKAGSEVVIAPKGSGQRTLGVHPPSLTDSLLVGIPKGVSNPDAFAVVVGVANYRDVSRVEYARQDAEAMRRYLVEAFGYQEGNVVFLPDPSKADLERTFGTAGNAEGQLYNWTSRKPNQSDVFVYYVGHGAPSIKEKKGYLVPADASPDYIEINGYPLDVFYANLNKVPARSVTVVLDACFTGETPDVAGKVSSFLGNASPLVPATLPPELPTNATVMTAGTDAQLASWYPEKKHSLFTYYLLKGLRGEADADKDGTITLGEMKSYLDENVTYTARRLYGRDQTPEVHGRPDAELLRIK